MEKVIYLLWRPSGLDAGAWAANLRQSLPDLQEQPGLRSLQFNVQDEAVEPASALRRASSIAPPDALVQIWFDSAIQALRASTDESLARHASRIAAYLVTESQPLVNHHRRSRPGVRTEGFAQLALLKRPARLTPAQWLDIWQNRHTRIAIETQSTFEYIQNLVVRALSADAPHYDAFVEECFPAAAMSDPYVFFDAPGDPEKFQRNLDRMMESVQRFIDMDALDVLPTSQYRISP
ncbi:EthD domain-containing protein [Hydrocarboniphaga sp.]|uniref:EthD domain-containing protein n=1 Tax=Hydrocarboniphaga sp. TaxID=2033016 RepID=UPI00262BA3C1|nr:EthD domain-containing protein [Hydrocarboniphaga sp.]